MKAKKRDAITVAMYLVLSICVYLVIGGMKLVPLIIGMIILLIMTCTDVFDITLGQNKAEVLIRWTEKSATIASTFIFTQPVAILLAYIILKISNFIMIAKQLDMSYLKGSEGSVLLIGGFMIALILIIEKVAVLIGGLVITKRQSENYNTKFKV